MMTLIIKNLPILIVITPLMFSLIVSVLSYNRLAWALSTFASFLTMILKRLLYLPVKKMEDCGIEVATSPSEIGKTLLNKLSN